ncbi:MAG: sigma 54-interacting transcriptional regulator [Deltaproteobacteria bacterium]|nr:sigma 54-interacting transcriptional regulator [Deltaproteobacteria bacterium]
MFSTSSRWRLVVAAGTDVLLRLPLAEGSYLLGPGAQDELRLLDVKGEIVVGSDGVSLTLDGTTTLLQTHPATVGKYTLRAERTMHASGRTQSMPDSEPQTGPGPILITPPRHLAGSWSGPQRFAKGEVRIGYDETCDLQVRSEFVSQFHCAIMFRKNQIVVRDLGSKNGTYLNDVKIVEAELTPPVALRVGDVTLKIERAINAEQALASHLIGKSVKMQEVNAQIVRFAATKAPVLILGESGCGKELIARALHELSPHSKEPFVVVNCGALAANLIESELFGHAKGAFTGASERRAGAFASADKGTLFLDEIGELPLELQPTLLRAIETSEIKAVGDDVHRKVNVRLVAATHRDLHKAHRRGGFREDLYHRLSVLTIDVPPLRERGDDVVLIAEHFLADLAPEGRVFRFSSDAVQRLKAHPFMGNVRELRNAVTRAIVLAKSDLIAADDLGLVVNADDPPPVQVRMDNVERNVILKALRENHGNRLSAAKTLGIARSTLYRKMDEYGISENEIYGTRGS